MKTLFLNCTLKKSPTVSNTEAFIKNAIDMFNELDVSCEMLRLVDHDIKFGVSSDESKGDEWPSILQKIYQSDILIIASPIWRGDRSSIAKIIAERMDGIMEEGNDNNGQYPTYSKVAGVMIDGNEDGAKNAIGSMLMDLSEHGFSIPVNAYTYYVGKAGPGPSYIEANGAKHEFTNKTMLFMIHNLVHLAKTLKDNKYPTNIKKLEEQAKKISTSAE